VSDENRGRGSTAAEQWLALHPLLGYAMSFVAEQPCTNVM